MIELFGYFFEDIDECFLFFCIYGMCYNSLGLYSCICDSGWIGFNCDIGIYYILCVLKMLNILKLYGI